MAGSVRRGLPGERALRLHHLELLDGGFVRRGSQIRSPTPLTNRQGFGATGCSERFGQQPRVSGVPRLLHRMRAFGPASDQR